MRLNLLLRTRSSFIRRLRGLSRSENGSALPMPYACPLGQGLFELRERVGKVRYRVFYMFDGGRVVVLLHAAVKDQRVLEADIALARRRLKDYVGRR